MITEGEEPCTIRRAFCRIESQDGFLERLRRIAGEQKCHIVCFDAEKMAGSGHVKSALFHAYRSFFVQKTPIANSFEMEALLWAGATRQCQEAVSFGIHDGDCRLYVCICPKSAEKEAVKALSEKMAFPEGSPESWDGIDEEKAAHLASLFSITEEELRVTGRDRITELIIERVALLEVTR